MIPRLAVAIWWYKKNKTKQNKTKQKKNKNKNKTKQNETKQKTKTKNRFTGPKNVSGMVASNSVDKTRFN